MTVNIHYRTEAIAAYFQSHRRRFQDFYESERWIFECVAERRDGNFGRVLDVGCACGGLAVALAERFSLAHYTGIDISPHAIALALRAEDLPDRCWFVQADIVTTAALAGMKFDTVFNLSCADWNLESRAIIEATWDRVAEGGTMILSLRLTDKAGVQDVERSHQVIHFGDVEAIPANAERAAYAVFNVTEALGILADLRPSRITGFGYWGKPSPTARTPFDRLAFAVFAVDRPAGAAEPSAAPVLDLHLPWDIWAAPSRA
jgi:SAM-dependent methyltransferase